MKKMLFLGCLLSFPIMSVYCMDQASLALVTLKEVTDLATSEAMRLRLESAGFCMNTENETVMDSQMNFSNFNYDAVVKNQVVPLILQQRIAHAQVRGIAFQEGTLKQLITANVLAVWNARKK